MTLSVHLTVSNYERSGAQGCEGGSSDDRGLAPSRLSSPGISKAHGPGWAGYDRRDTRTQRWQNCTVLARNMAPMTVAPAASIAAMNAADDCPVV